MKGRRLLQAFPILGQGLLLWACLARVGLNLIVVGLRLGLRLLKAALCRPFRHGRLLLTDT